jgi:hypothetical protein
VISIGILSRNPGTLELNVHDTTKLLLDDLDATRSLRYDADTCKIRFPDLTLSLTEAINFFNKIETTARARPDAWAQDTGAVG